MSDDDTFLKRWSRKKRLEADATVEHGTGSTGEATAAASKVRQGLADGTSGGVQDAPASEPLDLSSLPTIDDLTSASDIKAFLDPRVPAALRDAALQRAWTLDPAIRNFIEVAENQWDWNTPGGAPGYEPLEDAKLVAQLLDHAVGAIMGPRCDDAPILSSDVSSLSPAAFVDVAVHKTQHAVIEDAKTPDIAAAGSSSVAEDRDAVPHNADDGNPVSGPLRRRHGGALPG